MNLFMHTKTCNSYPIVHRYPYTVDNARGELALLAQKSRKNLCIKNAQFQVE